MRAVAAASEVRLRGSGLLFGGGWGSAATQVGCYTTGSSCSVTGVFKGKWCAAWGYAGEGYSTGALL